MDSGTLERQLKRFLDQQGRLIDYPVKFKKQIYALFYLASKFQPGRRYSEAEINEILKEWHTFDDWAMLRRDMCDRHFFGREADGLEYWLKENQPTLSTFGLE